MPDAERKVFEKLEAIGETQDEAIKAKLLEDRKRRLKNYTATESGGFAGIQTSLDSHMVLKQLEEDEEEDLLFVEPRGGGEPFWVEREALRPFLFGKDVERWHVGWQGWWVVFPYFFDAEEGAHRFMPSTEYWDFELTRGNKNYRVFQGYPKD